ncbi:hypothetical protein HA49_22755 [Tatumella morbirosei]|uniref:Uncharacterized protein n=1 Tax=Tatumella morbirosei TaxID=642227 RepID=A0A0F5BUX6_9GAMM|nr:hypothetical protein HA49_22755 [Tatumella morbirosei]
MDYGEVIVSKETGGPAFPREDYQANGHERGFERLGQEGMSLRDYLAAKAMNGLAANSSMIDVMHSSSAEWLARNAYEIADAMLRARNQ